jgi:short-subunit dehydrogenase
MTRNPTRDPAGDPKGDDVRLRGRRVLLTGAASGIGRCIAQELAGRGAQLILLDREAAPLRELVEELTRTGCTAHSIVQDLGELSALDKVWDEASAQEGPPDALINNAGLLSFTPVEHEDPRRLELLFRVNVLAPMLLCRAAAASFRQRGRGHIVNVGSVFGSIAFAYFASYSATKFAIRGYTEALRRELADTDVRVTYVAPRATRTRLADTFGRMAQAVGMRMDPPERVAARVVRALERDAADVYIGFPESLYVRLNGLWPRVVDRALRRQDRLARPFAEEATAPQRGAS